MIIPSDELHHFSEGFVYHQPDILRPNKAHMGPPKFATDRATWFRVDAVDPRDPRMDKLTLWEVWLCNVMYMLIYAFL